MSFKDDLRAYREKNKAAPSRGDVMATCHRCGKATPPDAPILPVMVKGMAKGRPHCHGCTLEKGGSEKKLAGLYKGGE